MLGLLQVLIGLYCQVVNIYLLANQYNVKYCIMYFVMLEIILELTKMYLEALRDPYMEEALHKHPKILKRGVDIKWSDRNCFHKIARFVYKCIRLVYCSVIFYFVPFSVYFISSQFAVAESGEGHASKAAAH